MARRIASCGVLVVGAVTANAQVAREVPTQKACAPIPAARGVAVSFGHEGGLLRPRAATITADGLIRTGSDSATDSVAVITSQSVTALATLARTGGFWTLPPRSVRRPPRNPDAARSFIAVHLTCGSRRREYVMGEPAPAAFVELHALLSTIVDRAAGR